MGGADSPEHHANRPPNREGGCAMVRYVERHELHDGRVLLYIDGDKKKPIWNARFRLPGVNGYTLKSSGTTNLAEAVSWADNLFTEMKVKVKNNLPIKERRFKDAFEAWLKEGATCLSEHRERLHCSIGRRYFVEFFGEMDLVTITDSKVEDYWDWRRSYWTTGPGKDELSDVTNAATSPAAATLRMDKGLLNQAFKWFKRKGWMVTLPVITITKSRSAKGVEKASTTRRPHFTPEDMATLIAFLGDWPSRGKNGLHKYYRALMGHAVMICYYSGLRPNELFQLRWCDITHHKGNVITFHIAPTTKTGERTCVVMPQVLALLEELHKLTGKPMDGDDLVIIGKEGKTPEWGYKTLKAMLKDAKVARDSFGRIRTLYSFRHTYATERLLAGVPVDKLAKNMGTSVSYIEKHYDHTTNIQNAETLNKSNAIIEDAAELTRQTALPTGEKVVDMDFLLTD